MAAPAKLSDREIEFENAETSQLRGRVVKSTANAARGHNDQLSLA
jgi:hypothetical protein